MEWAAQTFDYTPQRLKHRTVMYRKHKEKEKSRPEKVAEGPSTINN